jgi:hypothetical protein
MISYEISILERRRLAGGIDSQHFGYYMKMVRKEISREITSGFDRNRSAGDFQRDNFGLK